MPSAIFELKKKIEAALPQGELPWGIFGRINLKTRVSLGSVKEDTEVPAEDVEKVRAAAKEILGSNFTG